MLDHFFQNLHDFGIAREKASAIMATIHYAFPAP